MYLELPHLKRPPKQAKKQLVTRPGTPVGLSRGLHKDLRQELYKDLHRSFKPKADDVIAVPKTVVGRLPGSALTPAPGASIRRVALLSGETVTHSFSTDKGLVAHPEEQGRMLVLTNLRVIVFGQKDGMRETAFMPVDAVKAVAVNSGRRGMGSMFQGALMVVAGVFFYVLLAYWLTGRVDGPTVPIIRMDLVAFLIFLAVLSGVGIIAQYYFSKPDGEVTFQGDGVKVTFPFKGETAEDQIYQVVNAAFAARQSIVGETQAAPD